jgi:hypothetical protein
MNFKAALTYRTHCLIHNKPMLPWTIGSDQLNLTDKTDLTEAGLDYFRPSKKLHKNPMIKMAHYNYDNTYERTASYPKKWFGLPIVLYMACIDCTGGKAANLVSSKTVTIRNIRAMQHFYTIAISGNADNKFDSYLMGEFFYYVEKDKCYHVKVDLLDKHATCIIGNCGGSNTLADIYSSTLELDLPNFDSSKIQSMEQLINKLKIYTLFS